MVLDDHLVQNDGIVTSDNKSITCAAKPLLQLLNFQRKFYRKKEDHFKFSQKGWITLR